MIKHKLFNSILLVITSTSLCLASTQVSANPTDKTKITQKERQAAADQAAAAGFALPEIGQATMAPSGATPRYFSHPNYANSPLPLVNPDTGALEGGIRKFVDGFAGLGAGNANNLGQYISVAVPDTTSYPGADYYEIAVVEFQEQLHSDLPPTTLRGYVQLSTPVISGKHTALVRPDGNPILMPNGAQVYGVDVPHYLGATIVAQKDRPVRIKFYNLLPTGMYDPATGLRNGDLFVPVDTTFMGSGPGPLSNHHAELADPQNPLCGQIGKPNNCYSDNRAVVHLHGGISPWISDGTPHQWITPANENTPYPQGVSVTQVPDMLDASGQPECEAANDGCTTLYYTNQQSARLSFFHDHSWGITRLNVYVGEAAGYLITDETERSLFGAGGDYADLGHGIPLVIQDKTFVPNEAQLATQDETWDIARWGGEGNLWMPHVYSPAQNPGDVSGVNAFGRWAYGPWFWPPTSSIEFGPVSNPYYDPNCDTNSQWCEPPLMPGTPYLSSGMEAFNDTPTVNGTVYPTMTVEPKAYRFRILSIANDRFFNFSLYQAVDASGRICDDKNKNPKPESTGQACTEVALNPDEVAAALTDPAGVFPTPMAGTEGPSWIQIASEGGFLPVPTVIPPQPTTWVTDPTVFNAGNVDQHSLLLAPAERADVIVDFSQYAGQTLILYNDAPAAFPARDPRYDYYTGNPDLRDTGGTPPTLAGYGPNTRTIMQIKVASTKGNGGTQAFDVATLQAKFQHQADGSGIFESGQNPIIVGQGDYNATYGSNFPAYSGLAQIYDTSLSFLTLLGDALNITFKPKMIQDEMGEAFDPVYGRMNGFLGVETPNAQAGLQNMILYPYSSPPTEIVKGTLIGTDTSGNPKATPIASADDGTQIWKITHNGVDTHPMHFHLYDVQLVNRVGWDGIIRKPDANELGWKDTVRVSPLEDTIIALRPILPHLPFDIPNSNRLIDPSMPEGMYLQNTTARDLAGLPIMAFNPDGDPIDIINHKVNFGWEYVYHCHILSHEEMDMMHAVVVGVAPFDPSGLTAQLSVDSTMVELNWLDNSKNEKFFVIERADAEAGPWTVLETLASTTEVQTSVPNGPSDLSGSVIVTYLDQGLDPNQTYFYRVKASNLIGDAWDYADPNLNEIASGGFPTMNVESGYSNIVSSVSVTVPEPPTEPPTVPTTPSDLAASAVLPNQVDLLWTDNADNEAGFIIERSENAGMTWTLLSELAANVTSFSDTSVSSGVSYSYRVFAFNLAGNSAVSNTLFLSTPALQLPAAPSNLSRTAFTNTSVSLSWQDNASNETGYDLKWSLDGNLWTVLSLPANTTASTIQGLTADTSYLFKVQAVNNDGVSANSNTITVKTKKK